MAKACDAVVVGGGIIGAAAAYALAKAGASVELVERGEIGRESSWAAGGVLTPVHLAEYPGPLAELCSAAVPMFEPLVAELKKHSAIDVELRRSGMLYLVRDDEDAKAAADLETWKRGRGQPVETLTGDEARRREPVLPPDLKGALFLPDVLQVRNHRLTRALVEAAKALGAVIRTGAEVTGFLRVPGRVNGVKTSKGDVFAGTTVVASGAWASALVESIAVRPVRGQMLLLSGPPDTVKHVILSHDQYLIPRADGKILVGSTVEEAGFDSRVTAGGAAFLLRRLGEIAPGAATLTLAGSWAGLRPATPDRLPVIGRPPGLNGLVVACGHYRNGILLAPVTAQIVADLVAGREPAFSLEPFRVGR